MCFIHLYFSEAQDLIQKCLSIRPSDRPTVEEILEHPWLRDSVCPIKSSQIEKMMVRNNSSDVDSLDGQSMSSQESI